MAEKTLILIKPDAVKRAISGRIISRFEEVGLKLVAVKMVWADEALAKNHYKLDEEWAKKLYEKTKKKYDEQGKTMEYQDHMALGKEIQRRNVNFLTEGPVIAIVLEGPHSIEIVRKMVGSTEPLQSLPGTIRGDFASTESYFISDANKRSVRNMIHASDSVENANHEISLWFSEKEIHSYKSIHDFMI